MAALEEYKSVLTEIHDEWKKAEFCIKQAEQVNYAVVFPAIKELRYAGRRIVDALYLIASDGNQKKISEFLLDAKFDCLSIGDCRMPRICSAYANRSGHRRIATHNLKGDLALAFRSKLPSYNNRDRHSRSCA
jgi:hypothetical protein